MMELINIIEQEFNLDAGAIKGGGRYEPLPDLRVCIYSVLKTHYPKPKVMELINRNRTISYYYDSRLESLDYDKNFKAMYNKIRGIYLKLL